MDFSLHHFGDAGCGTAPEKNCTNVEEETLIIGAGGRLWQDVMQKHEYVWQVSLLNPVSL